jgi:hypothetical protein
MQHSLTHATPRTAPVAAATPRSDCTANTRGANQTNVILDTEEEKKKKKNSSFFFFFFRRRGVK